MNREGLAGTGRCDCKLDGREIRAGDGVPSPERDNVEPALAHDEGVLPRDAWGETEGRVELTELVGKLGREPIELREGARVGVENDDAGRDEVEPDRDITAEGREVVALGLDEVELDDDFFDAVAGWVLPLLEAFAFDLVWGASPRDGPALHPTTASTSNNAPAREPFLRIIDMTGLLKNRRIVHHLPRENFSDRAYYTCGQLFKQHFFGIIPLSHYPSPASITGAFPPAGRIQGCTCRATEGGYDAGLPARGRVPEWPKGTGCKPVGVSLRRFESFRAQSGQAESPP